MDIIFFLNNLEIELRIDINKALGLLKENFYKQNDSEEMHYHAEKIHGRSYFDPVQRLLYGRGPWVTPTKNSNQSKNIKKRKLLLVGDLPKKNSPKLINTILLLADSQFQIAYLNRDSQLIFPTSKILQDSQQTQEIFTNIYQGKNEYSENEPNLIEKILITNGENPEDWYIINQFELCKIAHVATSSPFTSEEIILNGSFYEFDLDFKNIHFDLDDIYDDADLYDDEIKVKKTKVGYSKDKLRYYFGNRQAYYTKPNDLFSQQCKKTKKINLTNLYNDDIIDTQEFLKLFPNLEIIEFNEKCLTADKLLLILDQTSLKIKKLIFKNYAGQNIPFFGKSLSSLELIDNYFIFKKDYQLNWPQLMSLVILSCKFNGSIEISSHLRELTIDQSIIQYFKPQELDQNSQLTKLTLYLFGPIDHHSLISFIARFPQLNTLHLYVKDSTSVNLEKLKNIKNLIIQGMAGDPPVQFNAPPNLESLNCQNISLPYFFLQPSKLKSMQLIDCQLPKTFTIEKNYGGSSYTYAYFGRESCSTAGSNLKEYLTEQNPQLKFYTENTSAISYNLSPQASTTPSLKSSSTAHEYLPNPNTQTHADSKLVAYYTIYEYKDGALTETLSPSRYRDEIFHKINWNMKWSEFSLGKIDQINFVTETDLETKYGLKKVKSITQPDLTELTGIQFLVEMSLSASNDWQPLPGLTPYDKISKIAAPECAQIRFNKRNQQYEILFKPGSTKKDFTLIQYLFTSESAQPLEEKTENIAIPKVLTKILDNLLNSAKEPTHACQEFIKLRSALKAIREQDLQQKLQFCKTTLQQYFARDNFGNKDLTPTHPKRSNFEGVLIEGTGACRHRAMVFLGLCQYLGLAACLVKNDVHIYVEILEEKVWKKIDLGGHPAQIKQIFSKPLASGLTIAEVAKNQKTELEEKEQKENEAKHERKGEQKAESKGQEEEIDLIDSSKWDDDFSPHLPDSKNKSTAEVLTYLSHQKNSLLKLDSIQQGRDLYAAFTQLDAKKPIYYVESCDDITGQWKMMVVKNGKLETDRITPLKELITQTGGMLIINWAGKFTASEMASLMSMMDKDEPKLMGEPIAKNLQLLNLVSSKMELPSRFYSRSSEFVWPEETPRPCFSRHCERQRSNPDPIFEPSSDLDCFAGARNDESVNHHVRIREKQELDPSSAHSARGWDDKANRSARGWNDRIIVDLYGDQNGQSKSEQWRTELLGYIDIQGDQYTYVEGALAQALRSKKSGLELIDAPWHDPSFQCFMTRLSVEKRVLINGEHLSIPDGFSFSSKPAPEVKWPTKLVKVKEPEKWQADLKSKDIFYLNHSTFNMLFRQQKIDAAGKIYTLPGWLATHNGKPKQIILTETLSDVEIRRLTNALRKEPSPGPSGPTSPASGRGEISWVDLTTVTTSIPIVKENIRIGDESKDTITSTPDIAEERKNPIDEILHHNLCIEAERKNLASPLIHLDMINPDSQDSQPVWSPASIVTGVFGLPALLTALAVEVTERVATGITGLLAAGITLSRQSLRSGTILLVEDPYFWAQQLKQADDLLINIHEDTTAGELIESIKEAESKDQTQFRFLHQLLPVAQALLSGKNVILYGQLSEDLYYSALESLLAQQAQLKLFNQEQAMPVLGKLTIISKPLDFEPKLALQQQTIIQKPGIAWQEYGKKIAPADIKNFEKIKLFYQLAKTVPHGQVGTPEKLNLTFQQLQLCLQALREEKTDNPIKTFFQHQYQHDTENYAQLNVMAKVLFGQAAKTEGIRLAKLESYPNQTEYFWRRLNCLDPTALRKILLVDSQDLNQLNHLNLEEIGTRFAYWLGLQQFTPEVKIIPRNFDPQLKAQQDLKTQLAKHNLAVLKGFPGSGKTYTAYRYAKQPGKQCFVGEKNIERWLEAKVKADDEFVMPAQAGIQTNIRENKEEKGLDPSSARNARGWDDMSGRNLRGRDDRAGRNPHGDTEEAVLILDEFNLKKSGHWDFLLPLLKTEKEHKGPIEIFYKGKIYKIGQQHKVILTGNPESYPGRYLHENLNTTIYLKAWTRASLKKYILQPLAEKEFLKPLALAEQTVLEKLLDALIETGRLLSPSAIDQPSINPQDPSCPVTNEYLSVRDAKQCFMRYFYHLAEGASLEQAAYQACILEWGNRFSPKDAKQFKAKMQKIFKPAISEANHFNTYENASVLLAKLPADLYLSNKQREWLISMHENMDLQRTYTHHQDKIDATPTIKLGILMEGNSGLGKSRLALALLQAKGYKPISVSQLLAAKTGTDLSDCFIQFSASGNFKQDQQILLRAFDLGCKVILDELNLDQKLERVLNQLLTGKTKQGQSATIPGFYVFACQNSAKHAGSKATSLALYSRFNVVQTDLDKNDLIEIIKDAYQKNKLVEPTAKQINSILASYERMLQKYPQAVNMRKFYLGLQKIIDRQKIINTSTSLLSKNLFSTARIKSHSQKLARSSSFSFQA